MKFFLVAIFALTAFYLPAQDSSNAKWSAGIQYFYPYFFPENPTIDENLYLGIFTRPEDLQQHKITGYGASVELSHHLKKQWFVYSGAGFWHRAFSRYFYTTDVNANQDDDNVLRETTHTCDYSGFLANAGLRYRLQYGRLIFDAGTGFVFVHTGRARNVIGINAASYSYEPQDHDSTRYSENSSYSDGNGIGLDFHLQAGYALTKHLSVYFKAQALVLREYYLHDIITNSARFDHFQTISGPASTLNTVTDLHTPTNYRITKAYVPVPCFSLNFDF